MSALSSSLRSKFEYMISLVFFIDRGQPHFKKLKRNDFLTKVGEGGGHKTYCQK